MEGGMGGGMERGMEGCGAVGWRTAPSCGTAAAWPQGQPRAGGCNAGLLQPPAHAQGQVSSRERPRPWDRAPQPAPPVPQFPPPPQHPASQCLAAGSQSRWGGGGSTPPLTPTTQQLWGTAPRPVASRASVSPRPGIGDRFEASRRGRVWGQTDRPGVWEVMGAITSPLGRRVWWLLGSAELVVAHR